jgi:hypothetical protein
MIFYSEKDVWFNVVIGESKKIRKGLKETKITKSVTSFMCDKCSGKQRFFL